jgi:hypothetical protein
MVHVAFDQDLEILKFDVDLNSLPNIYLDGYEFITTFKALDFDNKETFYTDSNGLEMQKRIMNHREYYNITDKNYKVNNQNITANYYPINSAISLKDEEQNMQFTVSNDRSQGGSSLEAGKVELMQNRRIPCDDAKGEYDFLNETDTSGNGIRVPATYYVQLHDQKQRPSYQRKAQQKVADSLQYSFTDASMNKSADAQVTGKKSILEVPRDLKNVGKTNVMDLKYVMVPLARNKIMIRVQNLNDEFDGVNTALPVDLDKLARSFWTEVNPSTSLESVKITETGITGNIEFSEMEKRRYVWKTKDQAAPIKKDLTPSNDQINILPQQIKVFTFEYTSSTIEFIQ